MTVMTIKLIGGRSISVRGLLGVRVEAFPVAQGRTVSFFGADDGAQLAIM